MNSQIQIENRFIFLRFSSLQKAMHLGSNPSLDQAGRSGYGGNDNRSLTKAFFRDILSAHYRQTDLKVNHWYYVKTNPAQLISLISADANKFIISTSFRCLELAKSKDCFFIMSV